MRDLRAIGELEGEVNGLSWALALAGPKPKGLVRVPPEDPPVSLEPLPGLGCWLLEIGADPEPGSGTRQWGALLSDGQVGALVLLLARLSEGDLHAG
jgi:hypothetical protein